MPDYKTHELINISALPLMLIVGLDTLPILALLLFSLGYCFATFLVTPDLDIKSRPYNRWKVFCILWWPYKKLFKHRGLSHHCVWGPVSLITYCSLLLAPIGYMFSLPTRALCVVILGMVIAIEMHILADRIIR
ncbi:MAG: DUF2227 family putative metal-binding protein [Candidatus Thorarchaeota archaeon]